MPSTIYDCGSIAVRKTGQNSQFSHEKYTSEGKMENKGQINKKCTLCSKENVTCCNLVFRGTRFGKFWFHVHLNKVFLLPGYHEL